MERHPSSEEHKGGDTRHDEQVEVFCKIEESEVNTGVFGVITAW